MGCGSSAAKAAQVADVQVKSTATLLEPPHQKTWVPSDTESFAIFMDSLSGCVEVNGEMLQVTNVKGGPIGFWNNRPRTEKVQMGDFIVKVRKAGATQWIAGDTKQMLAAFDVSGPLEVEIKHAEPPAKVTEAKVDAPATTAAAPTIAIVAPVEAPVAPEVAAVAPEVAPVAATVAALEAAPEAAPEATPVAAPEAAPEATTVAAPVAALDVAPVAAPEATQVATPGAAPEAAPVAAPEAAPEAEPEKAPEAAPAAVPSETPVEQAPEAAPAAAAVAA